MPRELNTYTCMHLKLIKSLEALGAIKEPVLPVCKLWSLYQVHCKTKPYMCKQELLVFPRYHIISWLESVCLRCPDQMSPSVFDKPSGSCEPQNNSCAAVAAPSFLPQHTPHSIFACTVWISCICTSGNAVSLCVYENRTLQQTCKLEQNLTCAVS